MSMEPDDLDDLDARVAAAAERLAELSSCANQGGYTCHEISGLLGASFCAASSESEFVMVTVLAGAVGGSVYLTAPVVKDVNEDRLLAVDLCNQMTRDNPAYPCVLHDASVGWDILVMQSFPRALLVDVPEFFLGNLHNLPVIASAAREQISAAGLGGAPYRWTGDDLARLSMRSMA